MEKETVQIQKGLPLETEDSRPGQHNKSPNFVWETYNKKEACCSACCFKVPLLKTRKNSVW